MEPISLTQHSIGDTSHISISFSCRVTVLNRTGRVVGDVVGNIVEDLGAVKPVCRGQDQECSGGVISFRHFEIFFVLGIESREPASKARHILSRLEGVLIFVLVILVAELCALFSVQYYNIGSQWLDSYHLIRCRDVSWKCEELARAGRKLCRRLLTIFVAKVNGPPNVFDANILVLRHVAMKNIHPDFDGCDGLVIDDEMDTILLAMIGGLCVKKTRGALHASARNPDCGSFLERASAIVGSALIIISFSHNKFKITCHVAYMMRACHGEEGGSFRWEAACSATG